MRRFGTLKSIAVRGRLEVSERMGVGSGVIELGSWRVSEVRVREGLRGRMSERVGKRDEGVRVSVD